MEELRKAIQSVDPSKWAQVFTPPPVTAQDVTCFVEVQVTQRKPGRCVKLGGTIPACQSNEIVSVDTEDCH
jgi:type II secretory pathway component HofQ